MGRSRRIARPPPLQLRHAMYPDLEHELHPTSLSLQRWHMHGSTPLPLHLGQGCASSCSLWASGWLSTIYAAPAMATVVLIVLASDTGSKLPPRALLCTLLRTGAWSTRPEVLHSACEERPVALRVAAELIFACIMVGV